MRRRPELAGPQALPEGLVSELVAAGISRGTVLAMQPWKALEVLDLLGASPGPEVRGWGLGSGETPAAPLFAPRAGAPGVVRFSTHE